MLLTIKNEKICLGVDTFGAEMKTLKTPDDTQYIWKGDPEIWDGQAPVLFPFIARLQDKAYVCGGKQYSLGSHGFASHMEFVPSVQEENRLILTLESNPETKKQYPFDFCLRVAYELQEDTVRIGFSVENLSRSTMPFGIGGHPGFCVPLEKGTEFTDYYLEFTQPCHPDRVGFEPDVLLSGRDEAYPLEDDCRIRLAHNLFDNDAIILKNAAREVTLRSTKTDKMVRVTYPDMPYIGFWHAVRKEAPYVCIEPWSSLPGRHGVMEDLMCRSDLIHLKPGETYRTEWTISLS